MIGVSVKFFKTDSRFFEKYRFYTYKVKSGKANPGEAETRDQFKVSVLSQDTTLKSLQTKPNSRVFVQH